MGLPEGHRQLEHQSLPSSVGGFMSKVSMIGLPSSVGGFMSKLSMMGSVLAISKIECITLSSISKI